MSEAPSVAELVAQFKLKERGRDRGREERPRSDSGRLDAPETEVVGHCEGLFSAQLKDYNRHRANYEERMRPAPDRAGGDGGGKGSGDGEAGKGGGDGDVEQGCLDLRQAVQEDRTELEQLARKAQHAIGDVNDFKRRQELAREAHYADNRTLSIGLLLLVMLGETALNGVLFAANVSGGMVIGWTYAAGISLANVFVFGGLTAWLLRKTKHRSPTQKMVGWTLLGLVAVLALALNLLVGHYREALAEDFPPPPDSVAAGQTGAAGAQPGGTVGQPGAMGGGPGGAVDPGATGQPGGAGQPDGEGGIESCWRGPDEGDANQEALCLFLHSPFRLGGFLPYLLFLFGLAAWLFGSYKLFGLDDEYPGYGKLDRKRRDSVKRLSDKRADLIEDLKDIHDEAQTRLAGDFTDPADQRKLALKAFDNLTRRHRDLTHFRESLEGSVRGALDTYRNSNCDARTTPEPKAWKTDGGSRLTSWTSREAADPLNEALERWRLPDAPEIDPRWANEERAAQSSQRERSTLERHQATLRDCLEEQQQIINDSTTLDHYDRAGPQ